MEGYDNNGNGTPKGARLIFGIFMVIVYIGVGILFFTNVFAIDNETISYVIGGLLCLYGLWRGYRLYKGMN